MIKRKVRIFTRDDLFQEFLDRMDEDTSIAHYSVSKGEAWEVKELLEKHGYNLDSINIMRKAFDTLYLLNLEAEE